MSSITILLLELLHSAHHKDSIYRMTQGNWNGAARHRRLMLWAPAGPGGAHAGNWEELGRSLTNREKLGETLTNSFFFTELSVSAIVDIRERI